MVMKATPPMTPPTMAPIFGPPPPETVVVGVDPELAVLTHVADGQEVQSPSVWLHTSSGLQTGQLGAMGGHCKQRLKSERAGVNSRAGRC